MKKIVLEINNLVGLEFREGFFERVVAETLSGVGSVCLEGKKINVSVAFVSEEEMAGINGRYRKKDGATDVLSFSEYAKIEEMCDNADTDIFLGEMVICPNYLERSAREQEVSFEYELAYIFSHGLLHLLGFPHSKEMFSLQEKVAEKITK